MIGVRIGPLTKEEFDSKHASLLDPYSRKSTLTHIGALTFLCGMKLLVEWGYSGKTLTSLLWTYGILVVLIHLVQFILKQTVSKSRSIPDELRDNLLREESIKNPIFLNPYARFANRFNHVKLIHPDIPSRWTSEEIVYGQLLSETAVTLMQKVTQFIILIVAVIGLLLIFVFSFTKFTFFPAAVFFVSTSFTIYIAACSAEQILKVFKDEIVIKEVPTRLPTAISYLKKLQTYPTDFEFGIPFINRKIASFRLKRLQRLT